MDAQQVSGVPAENEYLFDLQGFIVLRGVLEADDLTTLNDIADKNLTDTPGVALQSQVFTDFLLWDEPFRDLLDHPSIEPYLRSWLGNNFRLDRYFGIYMKPGTDGIPLHGGADIDDDPTEYHQVHNGKIRSGIITVSWALRDMSYAHGGFVCVPGSHKSSFGLPNSPAARNEMVQHIAMNAGDVLLFNGALTHGGTHWAGPHIRRSLLFKYSPGHMAWSNQYLTWPDELLAAMPPSRRALFRPPYCFCGEGVGVADRPQTERASG